MKSKAIIIGFSLVCLGLGVYYLKHLPAKTAQIQPQINATQSYLDCLDQGTDLQKGLCLRQLAAKLIGQTPPKQIAQQLSTITDLNKLSWCHEFYHYVGWEIYQKDRSLPTAFTEASDRCDSGMYHGIVEGYIAQNSQGLDPDQFVKNLPPDICFKDFQGKQIPSAMVGICFHGLGHGFMLIENNDLKKALTDCDTLTTGAEICYSGAFMENVRSKQIGLLDTHPTQFGYDPQNPDYPCNLLEDKHKPQCYAYKGVSDTVLTNGNFRHAFFECQKIDPKYQSDCFLGVGRNIPGPQWSSQEAGKTCSGAWEVKPLAYKDCVIGAISFVIELHTGDVKEAQLFCDQIRPDYQPLCFSQAGIDLKSWLGSSDSLESKCRQLNSTQAQNWCLNPQIN